LARTLCTGGGSTIVGCDVSCAAPVCNIPFGTHTATHAAIKKIVEISLAARFVIPATLSSVQSSLTCNAELRTLRLSFSVCHSAAPLFVIPLRPCLSFRSAA